MSSQDRKDVVAELEALRSRLDESLMALAGRDEHVPMHDVVGGLLHRVKEQQAEIEALRSELADCLRWRGQAT